MTKPQRKKKARQRRRYRKKSKRCRMCVAQGMRPGRPLSFWDYPRSKTGIKTLCKEHQVDFAIWVMSRDKRVSVVADLDIFKMWTGHD